jgi:uncharacterized protein with HEPN domain
VPSKNPIQRLEDILENIALIEEFTAGMDLRSFTQDRKTSNAVERCLERISEAARKLGDVAETLCPEMPWPQLRAVGKPAAARIRRSGRRPRMVDDRS